MIFSGQTFGFGVSQSYDDAQLGLRDASPNVAELDEERQVVGSGDQVGLVDRILAAVLQRETAESRHQIATPAGGRFTGSDLLQFVYDAGLERPLGRIALGQLQCTALTGELDVLLEALSADGQAQLVVVDFLERKRQFVPLAELV